MKTNAARENWGSKLGFILAVAGSAIGLGNIWKFPYMTGNNGGGAFVVIYLLCVMICGLPIMLTELTIGRATHTNVVSAFETLQGGKSRLVRYLGIFTILSALYLAYTGSYGMAVVAAILGVLFIKFGFALVGVFALIVALLTLSYYSVIGGWLLEYIKLAFTGKFASMGDAASAGTVFNDFLGNPGKVISYHLIFLAAASALLWGGIKDGIEKWSKILMPLLFILLVAVIVRSLTLPGAQKGLEFFLKPDFSKLTTDSIIQALGQSFFTLSIGMAITITYGSYLKKSDNLFSSALWVIALDTGASLMAGLAIFPAVFAMNFTPAAGPSLIFQVLPATFQHFPGNLAWLWGGLFFLMLTIAALTSAASLMECGVTFLIDRFNIQRKKAVVILYVVIGLLGILTCVSIQNWDRIKLIHSGLVTAFGEENIPGNWFDFLDHLCANWIIPGVGMMTAIFASWVWGSKKAATELRTGAEKYADRGIFDLLTGLAEDPIYQKCATNMVVTPLTCWSFFVRYISPIIIFFIFMDNL